MLLNTLIILLIILIVVGALVFFFWLSNKKEAKKASIIAVIEVFPSGKSIVEFIPHLNIDELRLMKLVLLYAVKIRFALVNENSEVINLYSDLFREVITPPKLENSRNFDERLKEFVEFMENKEEFSKATKTGERFTINLIEKNSPIACFVGFLCSPERA